MREVFCFSDLARCSRRKIFTGIISTKLWKVCKKCGIVEIDRTADEEGLFKPKTKKSKDTARVLPLNSNFIVSYLCAFYYLHQPIRSYYPSFTCLLIYDYNLVEFSHSLAQGRCRLRGCSFAGVSVMRAVWRVTI
jgi:hypothetical protein